jgi:hypothetical protein
MVLGCLLLLLLLPQLACLLLLLLLPWLHGCTRLLAGALLR